MVANEAANKKTEQARRRRARDPVTTHTPTLPYRVQHLDPLPISAHFQLLLVHQCIYLHISDTQHDRLRT